nr:TetR-like C-terminal domain-containing protein [Jeotgalicoccus nanhaiensis]
MEEYIKRRIDYAASKDEVLVLENLLISYSTGAYFNSIVWWIKNDYPYTPKEMTTILLRWSVKGHYREGITSFIKD